MSNFIFIFQRFNEFLKFKCSNFSEISSSIPSNYIPNKKKQRVHRVHTKALKGHGDFKKKRYIELCNPFSRSAIRSLELNNPFSRIAIRSLELDNSFSRIASRSLELRIVQFEGTNCNPRERIA